MTTVPIARDDRTISRASRGSPLLWARAAGVLLLISVVAGGLGEFYIPSRLIVPSDAAATARNLLASEGLFRLGFLFYLVEALCDVSLTMLFYVLLRPAGRELALLAAFLRVISTGFFAVGELFLFGLLLVSKGGAYLSAFSQEQRNAIGLLALKMYGLDSEISMVFYGAGLALIGYLVARSGYLPRWLGVLILLGGLVAALGNALTLVRPALGTPAVDVAVMIGALAMMGWFLFRGVDVARWEERAAAAR